ncbi:MAG TPA: hypothetical protein VMF06_20395 [Candidatus Limnocylindria bacterium]|jgi:cell wall-associated NlpC family hydrolase|nr:hypothetical protein [Candidatus Limnocylindria bacterium]
MSDRKPYFQSEDRVAALRVAAQRWMGTPWCYGSAACGRGVDCIRLCAEIYIETGALPKGATIPIRGFSSRKVAAVHQRLAFLGSFARFEGELLPGDLIMFSGERIHFAIALSAEEAVHCLSNTGVTTIRTGDAAFANALNSIWTPIERAA